MKWLLNRLREPSTWAGLAMLVPSVAGIAVGGAVTPDAVATIAGGLAAALMKEKAAQ